jgi:hypothetical protein
MAQLPLKHNWAICLGNTTRLQNHFVLKEAVLDWLGQHPEDAITVCTQPGNIDSPYC